MMTVSALDFVALAAALLTLLLLFDRQALLREMKRTRREVKALRQVLLVQGKPTQRGTIPTWLRQRVIERCEYTCQYCNGVGDAANGPDGLAWHVDHVVSVHKGGPSHDGNLTLACAACNLAKGSMTASEFMGIAAAPIATAPMVAAPIATAPVDTVPEGELETDQSLFCFMADAANAEAAALEDKLERERALELAQTRALYQANIMYDFWLANGESLRAVQHEFFPEQERPGGNAFYESARAVNAVLRKRGLAPRYQEERR